MTRKLNCTRGESAGLGGGGMGVFTLQPLRGRKDPEAAGADGFEERGPIEQRQLIDPPLH